ncbi:NADH:flavin oxidoreductase/NADH oxidase [Aerococcaceae bacterium zg-BR9]|uniref:NADH:flavin oxidoreductase/NADH oxidase n=1 Tax=Aerococcaceae bacterium zg-1292 TaxID=2774330 RepID=UPI004064952B|nr:NADH:flavin oxidoreductase/NADH oxidase [Aerococcaceae bacterium zg-BR9]
MSKLLASAIIGGLTLSNRVIMPPMCMYEAKNEDGKPTPFHFAHYGMRAISKIGLIIQEATAVEPDGRITKHDLGLWNNEQMEAMKSLVDSIHYLGTKIGVQLAHAGRKASDAQHPLSPSGIPYSDAYNNPVEMTTDQIRATIKNFVEAAKRAANAGYDMIEIHAAHGYLIHQFLSPLANQRTDQYGGSLENRYRILREIIDGIKNAVDLPIWVRISADAYDTTGQQNSMADWQQMARFMETQGVKAIDVSTGGIIDSKPTIPVHAGYQTPYATKIKEAVSIDVTAVGLITDAGLAEYILQTNQADAVMVGRALLRNTNWLNDAANSLHDYEFEPFNPSYQRGQQ